MRIEMSFPPEMDQRITRSANRLAKTRGRSRNVGNLHIINTSVPAPITNPPEYVRTVTMTPKRNVQNPEPVEVKNIVVHKTPIATRIFAVQKDATMSFTKKKINAAKNFLQQHSKEPPVKKSSNSKVNLTDDSSKPSLSSNNPSSSLINNSLPNTSNSNMASNSPNGSLNSNSSNNSKSSKYKPVSISHQSHSCLALYEVDKSLKTKNVNTTQTAPNKEKKDVAQKEDSGSSWVPVDMKKTNIPKDISVYDKNKFSIKNKNATTSRNIEENRHRSVFGRNFPKEKKKSMKEIPSKLSADSKGERAFIHRYSGSSRYPSSRQEEERYYDKRYGLSRSSKIRRSRDYEREHKRHYRENYHFSQKSHETRKSFHDELEALEDVSDVPLDEDFEEVEAASWEDPNKPSEIPVGFRKYKIKYLSSKSMGFFKPKRYNICQNRTVVSCLNMEESVDVVSEAEYETDNIAVEKDSKNIKDGKLNASNNKLETTSKNDQSEVSETASKTMEKENSVHIPEFTDDKLEEKCEADEHVSNSSEGMLIPTDDPNNSDTMDMNLMDTTISMPSIKEKQEVISSSKFYYTCIPESDSPDFYQGHSLFQKYFDEWESHLIGLEYIVEIRDRDKTQAKKYYCGLCLEQLTGINSDGQIVTNHVSSYKHASAYMVIT